ncbi:unnamed protein product [Cylindrotheca closterium]|uniref:Uncharacterized protein n=1 Tax=Cylindrotheca closterium TaxID=2856 RepID=A0AAD2FC55_9STRA|nr:unnamed protein product [Cylindrotheca closterium]
MVKLFDLDAEIGITLLVVTSSPGGSYSNWWCSMFNADLALSVTMTAISTLLSVAALPANLLLYAKMAYSADITEQLDWRSLFTSLAVVIYAILFGLFCSWKIHSYKFNIVCNKVGNVAGLLLVIFSATVANTGGGNVAEGEHVDRIWSRGFQFYAACSLPCILGMLIAAGLATVVDLKKPERITVAVECCYQNVGIATSVALSMFKGAEVTKAMGVPLFYGIVEAVFVGIFCIVGWKAGWTKAPIDVSFWRMITTTYEVLEAERIGQSEEIEVAFTDDDASAETQEGHIFTTFFSLENLDKKPNSRKEPSGELETVYPELRDQNIT